MSCYSRHTVRCNVSPGLLIFIVFRVGSVVLDSKVEVHTPSEKVKVDTFAIRIGDFSVCGD
jgi:hypothetical protein